jgi:hypothetical protein
MHKFVIQDVRDFNRRWNEADTLVDLADELGVSYQTLAKHKANLAQVYPRLKWRRFGTYKPVQMVSLPTSDSTGYPAGSAEKIEVMRARESRGESLFGPNDRSDMSFVNTKLAQLVKQRKPSGGRT